MGAPRKHARASEKVRRPRGKRWWRAVSSLKLGVVLLLLLACAMAAATFYESAHTSQAARAMFYHTFWFNGLLAVLAVNILSAAASRWPFKLRHTGFLLTHLAISVILGGAVVTLWFGTEGTLSIREGTELGYFSGEQTAVAVELAGASGTTGEAEVALPCDAAHPGRGIGKPYAVADLGLTLKPLAYYPHSEWEERFVPDPSGYPAVELVLSGGTRASKAWLHTAPRARAATALGKLQIRLSAVKDAAELARRTANRPAAGDQQPVGKGVLTVSTDGGVPLRIDVAESLGRPIQVAGTGATVTVERYVPHATVGPGNKGLVSRSDRAVNPAIVLTLAGKPGTDQRMLFARFPDMGDMHGRGTHWSQIKTAYEAPHETPKQRTLALLAGPQDQLHYAMHEENGSVRSGTVTLGEAILPDALGVSLSVGQFIAKARAASEPRPVAITRKSRGTRPALNVVVTGQGEPRSTWLVWGRPTELQLAGQTVRLLLRNRRQALPFKIKLDQFEEERYPGLQRASMWRSHVTVTDPDRGLSLHRVIQMNEPLHYAGFTFFQSSFDVSGPQAVSVLSVSRDPGKWLVYGGFVLLIVGVATMVMTKRVLRRPASAC